MSKLESVRPPALQEAVRVRPNKRALALLKDTQLSLEAMADTDDERLEAAGLQILIEMAEKVAEVLA